MRRLKCCLESAKRFCVCETQTSFEVLGVGVLVSRALRNQNVWLVLGYVGIMLLMARAYS